MFMYVLSELHLRVGSLLGSVTPFCEAIDFNSSLALLWSVTIRLPNDFTSSHWPFCSARFPMATSIIPPFAAFFMKVLSFTLSDELLDLAAGSSCARATPDRLSAAITKGRTQNRKTVMILLFMAFSEIIHLYRIESSRPFGRGLSSTSGSL